MFKNFVVYIKVWKWVYMPMTVIFFPVGPLETIMLSFKWSTFQKTQTSKRFFTENMPNFCRPVRVPIWYVMHQVLLVDVTVLILRENIGYKKSILILSQARPRYFPISHYLYICSKASLISPKKHTISFHVCVQSRNFDFYRPSF